MMRGAECGIDHKLVRGKLKMCIKRKIRTTGVKCKSACFNASKLQNSEVRESLRDTFDNRPWEQFKTSLHDSG